MLNKSQILKLSNIYRIFSDPTRLKIITELLKSELSVNVLSEKLNMGQSAISHQLRLLRDNNIVLTNRIGQVIKYKIKDNKIKKILEHNIKMLEAIKYE